MNPQGFLLTRYVPYLVEAWEQPELKRLIPLCKFRAATTPDPSDGNLPASGPPDGGNAKAALAAGLQPQPWEPPLPAGPAAVLTDYEILTQDRILTVFLTMDGRSASITGAKRNIILKPR